MSTLTLFDCILIALIAPAAYRAAYMITSERGPFDVFTRLRSWVVERYPPKKIGNTEVPSWQAEGIQCILCVSFWATAVLALGFLLRTVPYVRPLIEYAIIWFGAAGLVLIIVSNSRRW